MKCANAKHQLTLHVSEDLPDHKAAKLSEHLAECAGCRAFHEELRLQRELMTKLNVEPETVPDFAAIIARHDMGGFGPLRWRQRFAGLVVASIVLAISVAIPWQRDTLPEQTHLTQLNTTPPSAPDITLAVQSNPPADDAPELTEVQPATMMKLYTDDPDVVIYWFGD